MDYTKKPTVFLVGRKRKDAPPEPTLSKEQMKECIRSAKKYVRSAKK